MVTVPIIYVPGMGSAFGPPTDHETGADQEQPGCVCGHGLHAHDIDPDGCCAACECPSYQEEEP